jgi:OOP family OmpA-OmpF porin
MKPISTLLFTVFFLAFGFQSMAQGKKSKSQFWENVARSTARSPWIVGLGWNVIDDDGKPFKKLVDVSNSWNIVPYPSKLSCEKALIQGWSVEATGSYNQLKSGKIVNNDLIKTTQTLISFDINGKFNLMEFAKKKTVFFDPYALGGFGYTYRSSKKNSSAPTANIGLGFNCWLYNDMIGINVQSQAKFALISPIIKTSANYLQHSLGIVYKFDSITSRYGRKPGRSGTKYKFLKTRKKGKK